MIQRNYNDIRATHSLSSASSKRPPELDASELDRSNVPPSDTFTLPVALSRVYSTDTHWRGSLETATSRKMKLVIRKARDLLSYVQRAVTHRELRVCENVPFFERRFRYRVASRSLACGITSETELEESKESPLARIT